MLRRIMGTILIVLGCLSVFGNQSAWASPSVLVPRPSLGHTCRAFTGTFVALATKSGRRFHVYRTGPRSAAIGILLLPGRAGLDESLMGWADRMGAQGYRVVAVRLHHVPRSISLNSTRQRRLIARERAAIALLSAPGRKIVTLGWGRAGALQSIEASAADPADVSGTVLGDGGLSAPVALLQRMQSMVLLVAFHSTTPLPKLEAFEAHMRLYGKPLVVHYYDIDPAAANPAGPHHSSAIAEEVWGAARVFFRQVKTLCRRCAPYQRDLFLYH